MPLRGARSRALLAAIVAMGGGGVPARDLCDRLWPDADGDRAAGNLKVALHRLRRLAGGEGGATHAWLAMRDGRVSLDPARCAVDSLAFRAAAAAALRRPDPEALVAALGRYGERPFAERGDEAWIADHRRELLDDYARVAEALGERLLSGHAPDACLLPLLQAAERVPAREALQVRVIRVHLRRGFPSEAMAVYRRTERALHDELDVDPGAALRACLPRIQAGETG